MTIGRRCLTTRITRPCGVSAVRMELRIPDAKRTKLRIEPAHRSVCIFPSTIAIGLTRTVDKILFLKHLLCHSSSPHQLYSSKIEQLLQIVLKLVTMWFSWTKTSIAAQFKSILRRFSMLRCLSTLGAKGDKRRSSFGKIILWFWGRHIECRRAWIVLLWCRQGRMMPRFSGVLELMERSWDGTMKLGLVGRGSVSCK